MEEAWLFSLAHISKAPSALQATGIRQVPGSAAGLIQCLCVVVRRPTDRERVN